jgi:hypothetical protein
MLYWKENPGTWRRNNEYYLLYFQKGADQMKDIVVLMAYLSGALFCMIITILIMTALRKGLQAFFESIFKSKPIEDFFLRLTQIIIALAGIGAALGASFTTEAGKNWLTLSWSVADQIEASWMELLLILAALFISLLLFKAIAGRKSHE